MIQQYFCLGIESIQNEESASTPAPWSATIMGLSISEFNKWGRFAIAIIEI